MKTYPFVLPFSVNQIRANIMSIAHAESLIPGTFKIRFRLVIQDRVRFRKYVSKAFAELISLPTVVLLSWIPSRSISAWLLVEVWRDNQWVVQALKLDWRVRKFSEFVIKTHPERLRQLAIKGELGIRRKVKLLRQKVRYTQHSSTIRANPEDYTVPFPWVRYLVFSGVNTLAGAGNTTVNLSHREWSGVRTPNYVALRKAGKLPVNSHSVYSHKSIDYGFIRQVVHPTNLDLCSFEQSSYTKMMGIPQTGPTVPTCNHLTAQRNRAVKKLSSIASDETSNIAQDIVQMSQTTAIITNTVKRLRNSIRALKKGNFQAATYSLWDAKHPTFRNKGGLHHSKTLAENWLELQYGWKPLLQDIEGVIAGLKTLSLANRSVQTIYASANATNTINGLLRDDTGGNPKVVCGSYRFITTSRTKFSIRYTVADHLVAFLAQTGFTNPVNLAWEILPYSFVVDWFLPIGPLLESFSHWDGLVFLDGTETSFTRESVFFDLSYSGNTWPDGLKHLEETSLIGAFKRESIRLNRTKLTAFPTLSAPSFKNPISTTHALNALALLRSAFEDRTLLAVVKGSKMAKGSAGLPR